MLGIWHDHRTEKTLSSDLDNLLGAAYSLDQLGTDRPGAVRILKEKFDSDADLRTLAQAEKIRLDAVCDARSIGGQSGCHVSVICRSLLDEALAA